jgi:hypothetical protein
MAWRFNNPFAKRQPFADEMDHSHEGVGVNGFGAPLRVVFAGPRAAPGITDNAGLYPYETYLSPRWTPIGGGIPNKRDIGTAPPAYSQQGVLVAQVGSPGILAGAFVSGPLTNVSTDESTQPIPVASFAIPAA